jgi:hypothetical protein
LGDDHVEIEISTWPDPNMALTKHFYKWMVNPYGAVVDQKREHAVGWDGFEWESAAKAGCKIKDSVWTMEMAIPWTSLGFKEPPKDGTALTLQLVNASDSEQSYLGWVPTGWLSFKDFATVVLDRKAPAIQVEKFGELIDGKVALSGTVSNKNDAQASHLRLILGIGISKLRVACDILGAKGEFVSCARRSQTT